MAQEAPTEAQQIWRRKKRRRRPWRSRRRRNSRFFGSDWIGLCRRRADRMLHGRTATTSFSATDGDYEAALHPHRESRRRLRRTILSGKERTMEDESRSGSVCLRMKGELAQISLQHLKPNDFIYVSGILASHQKFDASGEMQISYMVYVQDLNYVTRPAEPHRMPRPANLPEEMVGESGPIREKSHLDRMHLWQLFFASPNEWWDNRLEKRNPNFPDFKHKDTRECLWLSPDDPPWIRRHLEQYDASIRGGRSKRDANVLF
ncbi:hypothetical protein KSP40_PGU004580 [Platanthera guangdongensis]|uniref:Protein OSB1, mitochondrial n=1 Tax=Platanthera guangdongensis TaxID=2320717 RepID=A0ABR2N145_9ASPA